MYVVVWYISSLVIRREKFNYKCKQCQMSLQPLWLSNDILRAVTLLLKLQVGALAQS